MDCTTLFLARGDVKLKRERLDCQTTARRRREMEESRAEEDALGHAKVEVLKREDDEADTGMKTTRRAMEASRAALERAEEVVRVSATQSQATIRAMRRRIQTLETMVAEKDGEIRAEMKRTEDARFRARGAERGRDALEETARARLVALERAESAVKTLTAEHIRALEDIKTENVRLRSSLEIAEDALERRRQAAERAEDRRKAAECALAENIIEASKHRNIKARTQSKNLDDDFDFDFEDKVDDETLFDTPSGRDRLRLERRLGALAEKIRHLTADDVAFDRRARRLTDALARVIRNYSSMN